MRASRIAAPSSERNVVVLGGSLFGLAFGEELWQAYMPAYLTALGASGVIVGLFGSSKDLLDSVYQYPGGWLADRLGRRALVTFTGLAAAGYAMFAVAPAWPFVLVGVVGVMAWNAGAFPTTFAVIGDSLPRNRRATAFALQSVLVRVPRIVSAPLGGIAIASLGIIAGIRVSCAITLVIALAVLAVQHRNFRDHGSHMPCRNDTSFRAVFWGMPPELRRLLAADSLVRIGEGIAASFIVLFVTQSEQASIAEYGVLYAVQQAVAIAFYLPGGRIADRCGRRGVVALTFLFFALFPLAVRRASSYAGLVAAFVIWRSQGNRRAGPQVTHPRSRTRGSARLHGRRVLRHQKPSRRSGGVSRRSPVAASTISAARCGTRRKSRRTHCVLLISGANVGPASSTMEDHNRERALVIRH